jgi:hypothetical protein
MLSVTLALPTLIASLGIASLFETGVRAPELVSVHIVTLLVF